MHSSGEEQPLTKMRKGTLLACPFPFCSNRSEAYFAAGEALAFGAGEAFLVELDLVVVDVAAGLGLAAGLASGAGLAAVLCALWPFLAVVVFAGVSANATIGSAAQARMSISFFMSVFPSSGSREV